MYKYIIFDMDGTILDTVMDLTAAVNHTLRLYNMPERTVAEVNSFIGNGLKRTLEQAVVEGTAAELVNEMFPLLDEYYSRHSREHTAPFSGIKELFLKLKEEGCVLAVTSNKREDVVEELCKLYFPGIFDLSAGSGGRFEKKPAPEMTDFVISRLTADEAGSKAQVVYVGDSEVDLKTAANSGIDCISVTWGSRTGEELLAAGAVRLAHNTEELYGLIVFGTAADSK